MIIKRDNLYHAYLTADIKVGVYPTITLAQVALLTARGSK